MKQPYSCWLKDPGSVGWDRKGFPESNLHVCGKNDTTMAVYNMKECIEKKEIRTSKQRTLKGKPFEIKNLA